MNGHHSNGPAKRRRTSTPDSDHESSFTRPNAKSSKNDHIAISSSSKLASQAVSPFLSRHIPDQYAPQGVPMEAEGTKSKDPNTKYCYRHRPDLKCRRQADEPSMDQLQHELERLSQSDQKAIAHVWALFSASPAKHRDLMLRGILTQCCFPQLSLLSNSVQELIRIDFLTALPNEVAYQILCFLDTASLCKAAQVSQNWRALADDDVVWHRMCEQHIDRKCTKCGWGLPLLEKQRLRVTKRLIQLRATGMGINEWSPRITPVPEAGPASQDAHGLAENGAGPQQSSTADARHFEDSYFPQKQRPWKDVYKDRFRVGANWKHGRYSTKVFKGHTNGVTCLQFDDQILATGSYDSTIKIWNIETGAKIQTLRGHTCGLRCLQFDGTKLISGSLDKTLRIWNLQTGACIRTLPGHTDGVIGLHFVDRILASGSKDNTIRLWNFKDSSSTVLRGHRDWVNSVKIDMPSRTLFSASDDLTVRLWDMDTKATIKIFKGHVGHVQQVLPLPREFELGDAEIQPRDSSGSDSDSDSHASTPTDGQSTASSSPKDTLGSAFTKTDRPLPPQYMLTSGLDNHIHLWDVTTGACLRTFFGHVEGVWALAADTLRAVSGAQDCTVKVWDARSGRCERTFVGHRGPIACIGLSDSRICTGSEDCEVRMMSFKSDEEVAG